MTQPTLEQIRAAETRLAASRLGAVASVDSLRATVHYKIDQAREKFARPSTVAIAAGIGLLIGKFVLQPRRRVRAGVKANANASVRNNLTAAGGLVATLLSRFSFRYFSRMALRLLAARRKSKLTQPVHSSPATPPSHIRAPLRTGPASDTLH